MWLGETIKPRVFASLHGSDAWVPPSENSRGVQPQDSICVSFGSIYTNTKEFHSG